MKVTPHQLRHCFATLILNAGAPVLSVKMLLGHQWVDTTLRYARLYDGTVAADYYRAMAVVERRLALPGNQPARPRWCTNCAMGCWPGPRMFRKLLRCHPARPERAAAERVFRFFGLKLGRENKGGREESVSSLPSRRRSPWRSGCSPAEPYPPGEQEELYHNWQVSKSRLAPEYVH